jgi:hypothetical protein
MAEPASGPGPVQLEHTIAWCIDELDTLGYARHAFCERCGYEWQRPENDYQADTLHVVMAVHARKHIT